MVIQDTVIRILCCPRPEEVCLQDKGVRCRRSRASDIEDGVIQEQRFGGEIDVRDGIDVVRRRSGVEDEAVGASATRQGVVAKTSTQPVCTGSAIELIVARTTIDGVVATKTVDDLVRRCAIRCWRQRCR